MSLLHQWPTAYHGISSPLLELRNVNTQVKMTATIPIFHPFFRPLEISPRSKLTLGSDFTRLPTLFEYLQVASFILPDDFINVTHVDQLVAPLTRQQCSQIYKSLEFDHFLVRALVDKAHGVDVQMYLPSVLAKVILLLTMYQHHDSYELAQHVENIIGLAADADVLHLDDIFEAQPYASTSLVKPDPEGAKCPVCWDTFAPADFPNWGDEDDEHDLDDANDEVLMATTRCGHSMCLECLETWVKESATCTVCRRPL